MASRKRLGTLLIEELAFQNTYTCPHRVLSHWSVDFLSGASASYIVLHDWGWHALPNFCVRTYTQNAAVLCTAKKSKYFARAEKKKWRAEQGAPTHIAHSGGLIYIPVMCDCCRLGWVTEVCGHKLHGTVMESWRASHGRPKSLSPKTVGPEG